MGDAEQNWPEDLRTERCCTCCAWPRTGGIVGNSVWCAGVRTQAEGRYSSRRFPACCIVGPDYQCLIGTHCCILVPSTVFLALVAPNVHPALGAIALAFVIITVTLLGTAACVDPGIIAKQTPEEYDNYVKTVAQRGTLSRCHQCNIVRPQGTIHCPECNVCVLEMDHHCPWTGKCIGKNNIRQFYAFNVAWPLLLVYVIAISAYYIFAVIPERPNNFNFDGAFKIAP